MTKYEIFPLVLAAIEVEKSKMMYLADCGQRDAEVHHLAVQVPG